MKFSIKDFFSKFDQIRSFLLIWSHLLKKFLTENLILCALEWVNPLDNLSIMSCSTQGKLIIILLIGYTAQFLASWSVLLVYCSGKRKCWDVSLRKITSKKASVFGVILVRIFRYSGWIRTDTPYLSIFSPNAGKCWPEYLWIRTLFTHWEEWVISTFLEKGIKSIIMTFLHISIEKSNIPLSFSSDLNSRTLIQ